MVSAYLADVDFPPDVRVLEDRSGARGRDERGGAPARRGRLVLRPCRLRKPDRAKTRPALRRSGPAGWSGRRESNSHRELGKLCLSACRRAVMQVGGLRWLAAADRWRPLWTAGWGTSGSTGRRSSPPGCCHCWAGRTNGPVSSWGSGGPAMPSMDGQLILVSTFGGRSGQATLSSQLLRGACGLSVADRQRPLVPVPCGTRVARLGSDVLIARAEHMSRAHERCTAVYTGRTFRASCTGGRHGACSDHQRP